MPFDYYVFYIKLFVMFLIIGYDNYIFYIDIFVLLLKAIP